MSKKKIIQIFANGSLTFTDTFFQHSAKTKIYEKDHTTFIYYQKKDSIKTDSKNFINFKTKYLKF